MSPKSGVTIENESAVLRAWDGGAKEFGVLFVPETPLDETSLPAIQSAVDAVRGLPDPKKRISVAETADGYAFLLYPAGNRAGVLTILRGIAQALGTAGYKGLLKGAHEQLAKHDSDVAPSFTAVLCSTGAVIRIGEPPEFALRPPPGGSYWKIGSPEFGSLGRQCVTWAKEVSEGPYLVHSGMLSAFCREDQLTQFISEACANIGEVAVEAQSISGELLRTTFGLDGFVLLSSPSATVPWQTGLESLTRRVTDVAHLIDYGFIRRAYYAASSIDQTMNFGRPAPDYLGVGLHTSHFALKTFVPDIFGVQILGPGHPEFGPPNEWLSEDLPNGRRLVTCSQLERWYGADFPEQRLLDRARAANSAALFTYDVWRARDSQAISQNVKHP